MESEFIIDAVERLGGWAAVLWIVYWLTKRWELKIGELIAATERGYRALENEQRKQSAVLARLLEVNKK